MVGTAAADIVTLFGGQACLIVIDFDGGSPEQNTAYTYSQEDLRVSADVSDGFYPIGDPCTVAGAHAWSWRGL